MSTTTEATALSSPLELPNGKRVSNRIVKAAMSEQLGDARTGAPTDAHIRLYRRWAQGGLGTIITGNVMIDRRSIGEPRNVVVEDERDMDGLRRWAEACRSGDGLALVQLNHPGRQIPAGLSERVVAPSAVAVELGPTFAKPRALEPDEITEIIGRFAEAARIVCEAGFDGVQLHGAHGYLISQFLSPKVNQRTDDWGGDPERRRRFLIETIRATREAIGPDRVLGLKLNSADFQKGGFSEEESLAVIGLLDAEGVDMLEISGGTYESPAMSDGKGSESTARREAFFLDFAERVRAIADLPLMVTGGFRSGTGMTEAIREGATDLIGLARPLALEPELPAALLRDPEGTRSEFELHKIGIKKLDAAADLWWTQHQIQRMGDGKDPDPDYGTKRAVFAALRRDGLNMLRRRRG